MITGVVVARHALVNVTFLLDNAPELEIEFVLDTGFAGFLTLPPHAVQLLGLPYKYRIPARLADGKRYMMNVHEARVRWDDQERIVDVIATGGEALLGTAFLQNCDVAIGFFDGGMVTITAR